MGSHFTDVDLLSDQNLLNESVDLGIKKYIYVLTSKVCRNTQGTVSILSMAQQDLNERRLAYARFRPIGGDLDQSDKKKRALSPYQMTAGRRIPIFNYLHWYFTSDQCQQIFFGMSNEILLNTIRDLTPNITYISYNNAIIYLRENSPITQTTPEPKLLSQGGGWPREKMSTPTTPGHAAKPGLIVLIRPFRPHSSRNPLMLPFDSQVCHGCQVCLRFHWILKVILEMAFSEHCS